MFEHNKHASEQASAGNGLIFQFSYQLFTSSLLGRTERGEKIYLYSIKFMLVQATNIYDVNFVRINITAWILWLLLLLWRETTVGQTSSEFLFQRFLNKVTQKRFPRQVVNQTTNLKAQRQALSLLESCFDQRKLELKSKMIFSFIRCARVFFLQWGACDEAPEPFVCYYSNVFQECRRQKGKWETWTNRRQARRRGMRETPKKDKLIMRIPF